MRAVVAGVAPVEIEERRATETELVIGDLLECGHCPEDAAGRITGVRDGKGIEDACRFCMGLAAIFWHNHTPGGVYVAWPADGDYPAQISEVA